MNQNMKKVMSLSLASVLAMGTLVGCGGNSTGSETTKPETAPPTTEAGTTDGETSGKPFEGVKLKFATTQTASTGEENLRLVELVKEETGIDIEFYIIPKAATGEVDKTLVSLMAGDEIDLIYDTQPSLKNFYNAGVLTPLDEIAQAAGYDLTGTYGEFLPMFGGEVYGLPAFSDIWITLYNKQIFDDAGVAYPDPNNWTWEEYVKTAEALTNKDKGIYGSYMLDYDCYNYMYALQKGWEPYKADGTANFDDPLFKESVEFFYGLGNDAKIQPSILEFKSANLPWNSFVATGDYGMFMCGGWVTSVLNQFDKYPRDWNVGLLPMPYPEGEKPSTLTVAGCYAVPVTSKNKEAAFAAATVIAENQYALGMGRVPARVDLTDEEINKYIEESLAVPFEFDSISVESFKAAWFDSNRLALPEKIVGLGDAAISQIITEECQLYGQGAQDIDKTIQKINDRANKAIKEDQQ